MAALTAFVTDGNQRAALAIVRALGRRGVTVVVGDDRPTSLSSESRYCARHVTYPSPERHPANFDAFLLDFVRREKIDVLLPVTDVTTRAVSSSQDALRQHCAVAVPPLASYELVTDKCALLRTALRAGIPVPRSVLVSGRGDLQQAMELIGYPAVIKPVRSRILTGDMWLPATVRLDACSAAWR